MMNNGLYVHIPFCVSKCVYCDFLSFGSQSREKMRLYKDALINELTLLKQQNLTFNTVYIGGGTPTALPPSFLLEIISAVRSLTLTPGTEFTLEMNPGMVSGGATGGEDFFRSLRAAGVNRLSIGLQAWQDPLLTTLGRVHTLNHFTQNFRAARQAGVTNISVDVMFALPGQSFEMWAETLRELTALKPEHLSAYSLTPEEGTPLWDKLERGELILPGDEADRQMYHAARKMLANAGYKHYEISNFALPGYESRHNTRYWKREPYIGAGLGAASFNGRKRWNNTEDMAEYITHNGNAPRREVAAITERDALAEEMFLGLRLTDGVLYNDFFEKEIEGLTRKGLVNVFGAGKRRRVALTGLGLDLANHVFTAFIE